MCPGAILKRAQLTFVLRLLPLVLLLLTTTTLPTLEASVNNGANEVFNIGAVLSSGNNIAVFMEQIEEANGKILPGHIQLYAHTVPMTPNPIRTAQAVCDNLISRQVIAVIVSHPGTGEGSPASVSFTCGFYDIPVIGISNRDSSLSNKNLHGSFMRTISPYSHQADVWIDILKELDYQSVVFIHSSDNDGRSTLSRFQNLADAAKVKIETVIEYEPGLGSVADDLRRTQAELNCRVFILYANKQDAINIFKEVDQLDMVTSGYVWIVTEQALWAPNKPNGLLGLKLKNDNEEAHIKDSVNVVARALRELFFHENITKPPSNCSKTGDNWETGAKLFNYIKKQSLSSGATGRVAFDENGDRLESDYDIVNVISGELVKVGSHSVPKAESRDTGGPRAEVTLNLSQVIWPGNFRGRPLGYFVPTHLKIATIMEKPFVWVKPLPKSGECPSDKILCTKLNASTKIDEGFCCDGYCMDLLKALSDRLNFTYDLYLVPDGLYGGLEYIDGTRRWNGLVGELLYKRADMVIAPLTINPERAKVIEFSKPYKYQGIAMLQKRKDKRAKLASFLQPFHNTLWLLVMASVHVVALVLYLLDRLSPFGRYKLSEADLEFDDEKALNLSSAIWFAWGVLLNSGVGEKTPRSFSARVLGMVWAGFAMIVVASYTANLAAFLVLDSTETEITGLDDSRLRNPAENFTYATVRGSSTDMYFSLQVELSNMYRLMEETNKNTAEEAIEEVKKGTLNVFFWDQPRLEYEAAIDCELVISGETFGRTGYGIGLQKRSYWTEKVTLQILRATESGFMEALDNKWILKGDKDCENKMENFPTTLGLENMAGVFMLVGGGIVGSIGLIIIEIGYKRRKARHQRQVTSAKRAVRKWKLTVEKRKMLRTGTRQEQQHSQQQQQQHQLQPQTPQQSYSKSFPPPLPFTRSSQNTSQYNLVMERQRKTPENIGSSSGGIHVKKPDSTPFTIEKGMKEISSRDRTLPPQLCHQRSQQQLHSTTIARYPTHFNRSQILTEDTAGASSGSANIVVGPTSPSPVDPTNCHYSSQLDIMDIPPPPPPPSASPRMRPTHPLMSYPKKTKNFAPV